MKHAIITGATGFIGQSLVRKLFENNIRLTLIVRDITYAKQIFAEYPDISYYSGDFDNLDEICQKGSLFDDAVFFNLAWQGVYGPERSTKEIQFGNIIGSCKAVELASRFGCKKFIGLGTIMEAESLECCKNDGIRPSENYIYGEAKHFAHLATKIECSKYGLDHIWVMPTNVYGPGDTSTRLVNSTLLKITNNERLEFTDGKQLYDFVYVDDVARALCEIGFKGKPFTTYVISSNHPMELKKWLEILIRTTEFDGDAEFGTVPYTGGNLKACEFSADKLYQDTGFLCMTSFEDGINNTYMWIRDSKK